MKRLLLLLLTAIALPTTVIANEKTASTELRKNNADMLVHATRKTIADSGDKLSDEEKEQVEKSVVSLEEAIASDSVDGIESATKSLNDVLTPLTQKLYSQEDAGQDNQDAEPASDEPSDNTVDAEFEEVTEEDK